MDGFNYEIITVTVHDKHCINRAKSEALLVIHTIFRPLHPPEPRKRDDPLSLRKMLGEVHIADHKTCLVWDINTHYLRVSIPEEKKTAWTNGTKEGLVSKNIKTDMLESLIGHLNHAAHVILPAQYFLNWLRHLLKRRKNWVPQRLQLWNQLYLQLWMKILQNITTKGVPTNNIVFAKPPVTLWSDACEYCIGGYIENGLSWRCRISTLAISGHLRSGHAQRRLDPEPRCRISAAWHGKLMLKLLELLTSAVTIYMTILQMVQGSQILVFIDSSIILFWMLLSSSEHRIPRFSIILAWMDTHQ